MTRMKGYLSSTEVEKFSFKPSLLGMSIFRQIPCNEIIKVTETPRRK